jgi:hypothetical protein
MKKLALVILVLVACSKQSDPPAKGDPQAAPAPGCSETLTAAYGRLPGDNPQMASIRGKLTEVMVKRCTEDKWPVAVLQCYQKAASQPEMKACRDSLPPELKQKATNEIMAVMGGAGGGGMMHGTPPAGSGSAQ